MCSAVTLFGVSNDGHAFGKLHLFRESIYATVGCAQRKCAEHMANTTEHKLAVHMSFAKAVYAGNYKRAADLKNENSELGEVGLNDVDANIAWGFAMSRTELQS